MPQKVRSMTCCLKADAFSIPSSNYRDVRHDKWFHMDSSGYEGASAKNDEILVKNLVFVLKTRFFSLTLQFCRFSVLLVHVHKVHAVYYIHTPYVIIYM